MHQLYSLLIPDLQISRQKVVITGHLILVRHGEPGLKPGDRLSGWIDIPLSRKGIEEALECAKALENIEIDLAFASNLFRA